MLESLSSEELQFIKAIENYKKESGKLFPSWTEVLKIFKELGYKKIAKKPGAAKPARETARKKETTADVTT